MTNFRKAPLLSFSFGCPAIFLCGGPTKATEPTAILLRSGDILIMTHKARENFHAVPRIIDDQLIETLKASTPRNKDLKSEDTLSPNFENLMPSFLKSSANSKSADPTVEGPEIIFTKVYLREHRININVRQVF